MTDRAISDVRYSVCVFFGHDPVVLATYEKTPDGLIEAKRHCTDEGRARPTAIYAGSKLIFERQPF